MNKAGRGLPSVCSFINDFLVLNLVLFWKNPKIYKVYKILYGIKIDEKRRR
jgi:hypothetical protein